MHYCKTCFRKNFCARFRIKFILNKISKICKKTLGSLSFKCMHNLSLGKNIASQDQSTEAKDENEKKQEIKTLISLLTICKQQLSQAEV